jgi:hypothetical protein
MPQPITKYLDAVGTAHETHADAVAADKLREDDELKQDLIGATFRLADYSDRWAHTPETITAMRKIIKICDDATASKGGPQ